MTLGQFQARIHWNRLRVGIHNRELVCKILNRQRLAEAKEKLALTCDSAINFDLEAICQVLTGRKGEAKVLKQLITLLNGGTSANAVAHPRCQQHPAFSSSASVQALIPHRSGHAKVTHFSTKLLRPPVWALFESVEAFVAEVVVALSGNIDHKFKIR